MCTNPVLLRSFKRETVLCSWCSLFHLWAWCRLFWDPLFFQSLYADARSRKLPSTSFIFISHKFLSPTFSGVKRTLFTECSYKATRIMRKKFSRPWLCCHIFTIHSFLYRLEQLIKRRILKQGVNLHHGWSSSVFHVIVIASLFFLCGTDQPTVCAVPSGLRVGLIRSKVKKMVISAAIGWNNFLANFTVTHPQRWSRKYNRTPI